ncbi:MAG: M48 family metalloprotease [Desulfosarcina sp.]|nr:M48 family metalloprotease [Desulfobacterales bacterium]
MKLTPKGIVIASGLNRREFLRCSALAAAGWMAGCATNPVTGKSQFMLISEQEEIEVDRKNSPYQLSADYGSTQDRRLNDYIARTGKRLVPATHRPQMPYRFEVVNATYINAYAFPGGTIATTRGILLKLDNEAELASLLGHELGHVNARHTAQQMSKAALTQTLVGGASTLAGGQGSIFGDLAGQLGSIGAGALLAVYSRDNEREADALGLRYMAAAGYNPDGFEGLMDMLRALNRHRANAVELLFATHPMSEERYQNSIKAIHTDYPERSGKPLYRERYQDHTAGLRRIAGAIEAMQNGEKEMAGKKYEAAEEQFQQALEKAPRDYTAHLLMAKCQYVQKRYDRAEQYAREASQIFPREPQAHLLMGFARLDNGKYAEAYNDFESYDRMLPDNPDLLFLKGLAREGMQRQEEAARFYIAYLKVVPQGPQARHAYQRLVDWGYIRP